MHQISTKCAVSRLNNAKIFWGRCTAPWAPPQTPSPTGRGKPPPRTLPILAPLVLYLLASLKLPNETKIGTPTFWNKVTPLLVSTKISFMRIFAGFAGEGCQMRVGWSKMAIFASFAHYIFQIVTYNATTLIP